MDFNPKYLSLIPLLPLLGSLVNGLLAIVCVSKDRKPSNLFVSFVACLMPILAFVIAASGFCFLWTHSDVPALATGPLFSWMATDLVDVAFGFSMDHLSGVMTLVVTGVGSLIHIYSTGYMKEDAGYARYFAYLNLFLFFMLVLILGDGLLTLFVGWEGVGLCSYLLIGYWFEDADKAKAGKKAFVVNRIGDFGFLVGIFLIVATLASKLGGQPVSLSYAFIAEHQALLLPVMTLVTLCLFVGATGKSAQIPLYVWLPDAMAGPTPVSALIHAATMVTAGIYMVARLYFLYAQAPLTLDIVASVGVATAFMAALIAITQTDIKKVLAYSTVSQLGYMFLALGVGAPQAAVFHVVTHAFFKACLFLCAGSVIHALHHEQDIRHMGGLFKKLPATAIAFLISTLAIAGIPPFSGFFSKDEILWQTFNHGFQVHYIFALITAALTAFYMFRLFTYVFLGTYRGHHEPHHLPLNMNVPVLVLAGLAAVGGLMGVPEVLGGHNYFHHWLEYLTPGAAHVGDHHMEMTLMGVSIAVAGVMSVSAVLLYRRNLDWTRGLKQTFSPLYVLFSHKFFIDQIYEGVIIKPIHFISKNLLWKVTDNIFIDRVLVQGWSSLALVGARFVSWLQTGYLGHYLLYLWIGLAVFLLVVRS